MRSELKDLGTIIENLPDDIEYSFVFIDREEEILIGSLYNELANYQVLENLIRESKEKQVNLENINNFKASLYALFFSAIVSEEKYVVEEIIKNLKEIINERA